MRLIMQKILSDTTCKKPQQQVTQLLNSASLEQPSLSKRQSIQSQPSPTLQHKTSSLSHQSMNSTLSKGSFEQPSQHSKTSKLQIIKDKVSMMMKSSAKITLDSIKMESIEDFNSYIKIIQKPQIITHFSKNNSRLGNQILGSLNLPRMKSLIFLSLQNANITGSGFKTLLETDLPELRMLYLARNKIGDCQISQCQFKLNLISLTDNQISYKGIKSLRRIFSNVESLTLKLNPLGEEGLEELLKQKMENLKNLHLESCSLNPQSLKVAASEGIEKTIPKLAALYLNNNPIGKEGLNYLIKSPVIKNVQALNFESCFPGESISAFRECEGNLSKLASLNLSKNNLTDQMIRDLAAIKLPAINLINLQYNGLTIESVKAFSKAEFPWLLHLMVDHNKEIERKQEELKGLCFKFNSVQKGNHTKVFFNV